MATTRDHLHVATAPTVAANKPVEDESDDVEPCSPKILRKKGSRSAQPTSPWDTWNGAGVDVLGQGGYQDPSAIDPTAIDPTSPTGVLGPVARRSMRERRARAYELQPGEELFIPESHEAGRLLLRPDNTFAYLHDSEARFSEGVHGAWVPNDKDGVLLEPASFGWCYQESFDEDEIIGTRYVLKLRRDLCVDGKFICILPDELLTKLSWLNPTLPED